jgi:hypothetical protein
MSIVDRLRTFDTPWTPSVTSEWMVAGVLLGISIVVILMSMLPGSVEVGLGAPPYP